MTARLGAVVVLGVVVAAFLGRALAQQPLLLAIVAALGGVAVAALLLRSTRRRLATAVDMARSLTAARAPAPPPEADRAWQQLWTELRSTDEELRGRVADLAAQRARVQQILEGLPPSILLFDQAGLTFANRTARRLLRLDAVPATPLTPMQAVGSKAVADAVRSTLEAGDPAEVEVELPGERVLVARTTRTGEAEVALVMTDLTESRRVDAMRRDFVTNASHELKTPVAGIQALADSLHLAVQRDPARAARMVGRIQGEAARLATLVRELLDLARVEEHTSGRPPARLDLAQVVARQVERMRPAAAGRHVVLDVHSAGPAEVLAPPEDARLIVDNLLSNAVRYNRPGGRVEVAVGVEGDAVVLEVRDTGIGISDADRERVFERFYRVDKARSRAAGGTGLGLSLVRHTASRLGGSVALVSQLGEGSTFTVTLPLAPPDATADGDSDHDAGVSGAGGPEGDAGGPGEPSPGGRPTSGGRP